MSDAVPADRAGLFARLAGAGEEERATIVREAAGAGTLELGGEEGAGASLASLGLPGARLRHADLAFADLSGADLTGAFLPQAILRGAKLEGARLGGADLSHADARDAQFGEADLDGALLEEADLTGASFRFATLTGAALEGARLIGADCWSVNLCDADLTGADLTRATIHEAAAERADFTGATLTDATIIDVGLEEACFAGADLRGAKLKDVRLRAANFARARLQGVDLTATDLAGACWNLAQLDRTPMYRDQLGAVVGEEAARDYAAAAGAYTALQRNFAELGDVDAASWAYRRKRRMQKRAALGRAGEAVRARRWGTALGESGRYVGDLVTEWVCDYGDGVGRVFAAFAVEYLLFVIIYGATGSVARQVGNVRQVTREPVDLALFSLSSMSSGAASSNNLVAAHTLASFLAAAQTSLSWFLMGLLGFVAGNRIRR